MHSNEVFQACRGDPIYCDIFGPTERVLIYGLPINLRYIYKRVPALIAIRGATLICDAVFLEGKGHQRLS